MYIQYNWNKFRAIKYKHNNIVGINSIHRQRGTVIIFVTLLLTIIFSFTALAIDVGYLFVVRNELQNAADSAALAGANYLYGDLYKTSSVSCAQSNVTFPNWSCAESNTTAAIQLNKATNTTLTNGQVNYGYWNITGNPTGLQSTSIIPGIDNLPTVKVTISKSNGQNGGGIATFFAGIMGINTLDASATAVAVVASPGYTKDLFPVAITQCMYDKYWDSTTSPNGPKIDPITGHFYEIKIGAANQSGLCQGGQWTSFDLDTQNVPKIRDLIDYSTGAQQSSNPVILGMGDNTWIQSGVQASIYDKISDCMAATVNSCEYVVIPVVCFNSPTCDRLDTHAQTPITAFACIRLLEVNKTGSDKYVKAEMTMPSDSNCKISGGGIGPNYGVYMPPKLVNYSGNTY
ncbi:MAG: pilus assembly protein TadG-related protein [Methylobacter sp.]|nr:pilus assembly protein TadG-related protein [Methylobacter sp.]